MKKLGFLIIGFLLIAPLAMAMDRPLQLINRAEASKILFLSLSADTPMSSDCFKDVKLQDWFSPYVCGRSFIQGYADGFFHPEKTVTVAEALKMMEVAYEGTFPTVANPVTTPWYQALIVDAKQKNLIAVNVEGGEKMNRGDFVDLLYSFAQPASAPVFTPSFHSTQIPGNNFKTSGFYTPGGRFIATGRSQDTTGVITPSGGGEGGSPAPQTVMTSPAGGGTSGTGSGTGTGTSSGGTTGGGTSGGGTTGGGNTGGTSGGGGGGTGGGTGTVSGGTGTGTGGGGTGTGGGTTGGTGGSDTGTGTLTLTPQNYKVAFVGDSGHFDNFQAVLRLIRAEGAQAVFHQGDLAYDEGSPSSPRAWMNVVDQELGSTFPYFFSMGNHDVEHWNDADGYRRILSNQFTEAGITPRGDAALLGAKTSFDFNGLSINDVAPGEDSRVAGSDHAGFLNTQLGASGALWTICGWHKNMRAMQIGGKGDEAGWDVYETCRRLGAIIATAHEHSYERTHVLSSMQNQTVADNTSPYDIRPGQTLAFVSGLAGNSIRDQERCLPITAPYGCNGEWASIYTSNQGANYGALFITFYVDGDPRKARGYFKDINGRVIDTFEIINNRGVPAETGGGTTGGDTTGGGTSGGTGGTGGTTVNPEDLVQANGRQLTLGGQPFRFVGANAYGAANSSFYACGPYADSGRQPDLFLDTLFRHFRDHDMKVMRFWAFQSFANGGTDFSALDRVFRYANQYGIKVIPTLENQWDHCPGNIHKYADWYADGYKHPYGNYPLSFRDYVTRVATRYRNEPAIAMWQLMNEAESQTSDGRNDAASLLSFTRDVSHLIKSIDANHLVNLGTMGSGQPGTENENFRNLGAVPEIDVIEAHDYNDETVPFPSGTNSVANALSVAQSLNKPFFIGEAGIRIGTDRTAAQRATLFSAKIRAIFDRGGIGYLIWRWSNPRTEADEGCNGGYCLTEGTDPLLDVLESY